MKRRLIVNLFAYGLTWVLLAGLMLLSNRLLNLHQSSRDALWFITTLVVAGAFGDWFSGWLKSRQQR